MTDPRVEAVHALLVQTEQAHGTFEATELQGVYDQDWARWYAAYAVEHGLDERMGHPVTVDQVAAFLTSSFDDFQKLVPKSSESWAAYTARRMVAEL